MKKIFSAFALATFAAAFAPSALADDTTPPPPSVIGKWKGEFDSQIGIQKYTYEFKLEDGKLAGKAIGERDMGTNEVALVEVKLNKDEITFVEPLKFGDNDLRIEYKGKISGDEIKLHRKVGDIAEEDFVAKRVKPDAAKPETKPDTAPPAKK